jgi:hypothetical protein
MGSMKHTDALSLLFPLADAVGIAFKPWRDANGFWHVSMAGVSKWDFTLFPGADLPLNVQTLGSYIRESVSSVFCSIVGDLYLYAYYLKSNDKVTVVLLDGSKFYKLGKKGNGTKYDVADIAFDYPPEYFLKWSKQAQVGAYQRFRNTKEWGPVDVSDLVNGQNGNAIPGVSEAGDIVGGEVQPSSSTKGGSGKNP